MEKKNDKFSLEEVSKFRLEKSILKKNMTKGIKIEKIQRYEEVNWLQYEKQTIEENNFFSIVHGKSNNRLLMENESVNQEANRILKKSDDKESIEDSRVSNFSFQKLKILENICLMTTYISIFINLVYSEPMMQKQSIQQDIILYLISAITLLLIVFTIIRYYYMIELKEVQKIIKDTGSFISKLQRSNQFNNIILEILLILIHPNYLCKNLAIQEFQTYDLIVVQHKVNDLLAIGLLFRSYIILRGLVNNSKFSSPRASRLCRIHLCQPDFMYSAKCILKQYPLRTLLSVFIVLMFIFGYGLKLSQGPLKAVQGESIVMDFTLYANCFWCVIVTMGTIGYGDYFPKTLPGRLIVVLTAISGVILSSLLIVALSAYLTMSPNQSKSHICIKRLCLQKSLSNEASSAMVSLMNLGRRIKTKQNQNHFFKEIFTNLKRNTEKVKQKMRQIKSLVDNDNIEQEMVRSFSILKNFLKEIYLKQLSIKQELQELENVNLNKNSLNIANQVQKMVRQMHF